MKISQYIAITLLWALPLSTLAQTPEALFQLALDNNSELQAMRLEYQAALEKAPQMSQLPQPELGVGLFVLPVETRLGAQRARIGLSQMFPWFGTLEAQQNLLLQSAQLQFEAIAAREWELLYQIRQAYFQLYELTRSQSIIEQNLVLLRSLQSLSETKMTAGKASLADVLRIQLKIQELMQEIHLLENRKRQPRATINQLLQRPLDTDIALGERLDMAVLPFARADIATTIASHHPVLRIYEQQQRVAREALVLNEKKGKPSFGIGMDYIAVDPRTDATPIQNGRDIFQLRASISIPIYRQQFAAKEREESLRIEAIENRKNESLSAFLAMIETAYAEHENAGLQQALYQQQITTTQAAIQVLLSEYQADTERFDELLRMENELLNYEFKLLRAIVQSHLAKARIERYLPY